MGERSSDELLGTEGVSKETKNYTKGERETETKTKKYSN